MLIRKSPEEKLLNYELVRRLAGIKKETITIQGLNIHVAVIYGLPKLEKLLGGQPLAPISQLHKTRKKELKDYICVIQ